VNDPSPKIRYRRLRRAEFPCGTLAVARFLIGKIVVHDLPQARLSGRIVETEGYPPGDPAGHHFRGLTKRNRSLFLRPGHVYVYFNYGMHFMLNVSSEKPGVGGGVLIRAIEPLEGVDLMRQHRNAMPLLELTRGPGRLAAALRIDKSLDGLDLFSKGPLWLGVAKCPKSNGGGPANFEIPVATTVRIGITHAAEQPFRFYERGNPFVSGPKRLLARDPSQIIVKTP
jgi:DNA-3-methyladenine glycosylase